VGARLTVYIADEEKHFRHRFATKRTIPTKIAPIPLGFSESDLEVRAERKAELRLNLRSVRMRKTAILAVLPIGFAATYPVKESWKGDTFLSVS
jgi:hypothetical protein